MGTGPIVMFSIGGAIALLLVIIGLVRLFDGKGGCSGFLMGAFLAVMFVGVMPGLIWIGLQQDGRLVALAIDQANVSGEVVDTDVELAVHITWIDRDGCIHHILRVGIGGVDFLLDLPNDTPWQ